MQQGWGQWEEEEKGNGESGRKGRTLCVPCIGYGEKGELERLKNEVGKRNYTFFFFSLTGFKKFIEGLFGGLWLGA